MYVCLYTSMHSRMIGQIFVHQYLYISRVHVKIHMSLLLLSPRQLPTSPPRMALPMFLWQRLDDDISGEKLTRRYDNPRICRNGDTAIPPLHFGEIILTSTAYLMAWSWLTCNWVFSKSLGVIVSWLRGSYSPEIVRLLSWLCQRMRRVLQP